MDCLIDDVPPAKLARFIIHVLTMKKRECKSSCSRIILDAAIRILLSEEECEVFPNGLNSELTDILHKAWSETEHTQNHIAKNVKKVCSGQEETALKAKKRHCPKQSDLVINTKNMRQENKGAFPNGDRHKTKKKPDSILLPPKKIFLHPSPSTKNVPSLSKVSCPTVRHTNIASPKKLNSLISSQEERHLKTKRRFYLSPPLSGINAKHSTQDNEGRDNRCKIKEMPLGLLTPRVLLHKLPHRKKYIISTPNVKNPSIDHMDIVSSKKSKKLISEQKEIETERSPPVFNVNIKDTEQENKPSQEDIYQIKVKADSTITKSPTHMDVASAKMPNNLSTDQEERVLSLKERLNTDLSVSSIDAVQENKPTQHRKTEIEEKPESSLPLTREVSSHESSHTKKHVLPLSEVTDPPIYRPDIQPPKIHRSPLLPLPQTQHKRTESNHLFGTNAEGEALKPYIDDIKKVPKFSSVERVSYEPEPKKSPLLPLPADKNPPICEGDNSPRRVLLPFPTPYSKWRKSHNQRKKRYVTYYYQVHHTFIKTSS